MKSLPDNLKMYKQTKIFDQNSIPKGLLKDHSTMEGVWGRICILEGKLLYTIQSNPIEEIELSCEKYGVVEAQVLHFVSPIRDVKVKFYVEFYK